MRNEGMKADISLPHWLEALGWPDALPNDAAAIQLTLDLARDNVSHGGGPFGALVREEATGRILSVGVNRVRASGNPVLHAEVVAIALAGREHWDEGEAALFTSCEPCIMCLGAVHWSGIRRVVFAAHREDAEAIGFSEGAGCSELKAQMAARGVAFEGGMLREQAVSILKGYAAAGGAIYGPARD
jgi:tRNA(Arg) A34 adenosine deaminase TadA